MPARRFLPLAVALLASATTFAPPAHARARKTPPPAPTQPAAPEKPWPLPPPLQIDRFTLANGMRVVVQTDRKAPLVAVGIMVDVGARDEEQNLTGLAHFFEHMMFQGSEHAGKMEHFRALEAAGAELNANTSTDRTWYYEVVPKPALELALWLEADRFAHLHIDSANVDNQRQAVLEERRERLENRPYAAAMLTLEAMVYAIPSLQHPTIGEAADVQKAPLEAFRAFWQKWYSPNNAVLVLVGDLDVAEARTLAEKYLGRVERRAEPKHASFDEPAPVKHQYAVHEEKLGKTPAFHLAWRVPAAPNPDSYALDLLAEVLGGGEASRLDKKLTRDKTLATSYFVGGFDRRGEDVFDVNVEMAAPGSAALVEAKRRVREEIQDVALHGVSADELRRAKVAFEAAYVFGSLAAGRRAELLAQYELYFGDAARLQDVLPKYRAVTSQDLQRVAATLLTWNREVELDVVPTAMARPKEAGGKPEYVTKFEQAQVKAAAEQRAREAAETKAREAAEQKAREAEAKAKVVVPPPAPVQEPAPAAPIPEPAPASAPAPAIAPPAAASPTTEAWKPLRKVKKGGAK
jgi:zinc protease